MASKTKEFLNSNRYNILAIFVIAAVTLLFFFRYTDDLQQTDTYAKWFYSISTYRSQYLENARYGEWLYMEFFYRVMGEPQHFRAFHVCVGLVLNMTILFVLWRIACSKIYLAQSWFSKGIVLAAVISLRTNVFYTDIFQFGTDTAPMFIGDLMAVAAGWLVVEKPSAKRFVSGAVLLCAALFFRQTCLLWFVLTGLFVVFCDSELPNEIRAATKKVLRLLGSVFLAVVPVLFCTNVISPPGSRGSFSSIDLAASRESFINTFANLLRDCDGIQPQGFYSLLLAVILCLGLMLILAGIRKHGVKSRLFVLLKWLIITVGVLAGTFFPVIFQTFLPHRITCGFATLLPLWTLLIVYQVYADNIRLKSAIQAILGCVLLLNLCVNFIYTANLYEGMVETNRVDRENARYYYDRILSYEAETGTSVNNVAWHFDKNFTWNLPGVTGSKNINNRAYCLPWGQREILPFVTGRRFDMVEYDEEIYRQYYGDADWNELNDAQVMFVDDTAYIVLY